MANRGIIVRVEPVDGEEGWFAVISLEDGRTHVGRSGVEWLARELGMEPADLAGWACLFDEGLSCVVSLIKPQ